MTGNEKPAPHADASADPARLRVIMWGSYDLGKPRTRIIRKAFDAAGLDICEIHFDPWRGVEDKSQLKSRLSVALIALRLLLHYPALILRYLLAGPHDAVFVGYMGVLDVLLIAPFARLRGKPVVWDAFLSVYDTTVVDRGLLEPASLRARLLRRVEGAACRLADLVVLDTKAHAVLMAGLHEPGSARFRAVMVGCEEGFRPLASSAPDGAPLDILFYGQFIPLHGIETIVRAAQASAERGWTWTLIGKGQESAKIDRMLEEADSPHIRRIEWVPYARLAEAVAGADICLGIFGGSAKAASVIPNKVFQILAAGKPLVTRDSPAMRELVDGQDKGLYLVPPSDPEALLRALGEFERQRHELAPPLHDRVCARFALPQLAAQWRALFEDVAGRAAASHEGSAG